MSNLTFSAGVRHALPIALGYIPVAFAFGMISLEKGLPIWSPIFLSLSNFTGTGQFVGMKLISISTALLEIAVTLLVINARYFLMSLAISQKLDEKVTLPQRLLIAFGITDEVYAVSMQQKNNLNFPYMMGLIVCAYSGWQLGTILGAFASNILPASLVSALGIAIYAMFIAIIIPPARESSNVLKVVLISIAMSSIFSVTPILKELSSGWVIIICGVVSSALIAFFHSEDKDGGN